MIGKITGTLTDIYGTDGIIETASGIGYRVTLPPRLIGASRPYDVALYLHHAVREDAQTLYGFESLQQLEFFYLVYGVSGIGPKTAHTIVLYGDPQNLISAVKHNDVAFFTKIPGLGKKTAQKLILELSQKMERNVSLDAIAINQEDKPVAEALAAIGFDSEAIRKIITEIPEELTLEEKITHGIKLLGNGR